MAFNVPINSIAPLPTPTDWVRPPDWIAITNTTSEVQFLVADTGLKAFSIKTEFVKMSGTNIYIDWGDGVIDTISTETSTTTSHVYSTGGTPCSRGYNTFKIRIYGDLTCIITNVKHISNFAVAGGNIYYNVGVLEAYFGSGTMGGMAQSLFSSNGGVSSVASFLYLEHVQLPNTTGSAWTTQMSYMFQNCTNLSKVVMPTSSSGLTNMTQTFSNCFNLRDIVLPSNATSISNMTSTFSTCRSLRTVVFPTNLNACISFATTFSSCSALKNVTLPSINLVTDLSSSFSGCTSLQWFKFTSMPAPVSAGTSVNLSSMLTNCTVLQNVYFPSSCSGNAVYNFSSTFSNSSILKNIIFPTNFNPSTLNGAFGNCYSLTRVVFQSVCPSLTDMSSAFSNNYLLSSVVLPNTVGSSISLATTFQSCYSLESITIPSGWILNSLGNTFSNCITLKTVVLPNNAQNSLSSMSSTFSNCYELVSVTMPTSLNLLNTLSSTFSNCWSLQSIVLPTSLPALTSLGTTFNACYNLTSLTLPTSTPALTSSNNTFQNCIALQEITMPATVSASLTQLSATFYGCTNLKTLTLPTTQTASLTFLTSMIYQCGSLTTINNLGKLGSLTATPLVSAGTFSNFTNALTSLSFNCPFSALNVSGASPANFNRLNSLRLLNTGAGQWTGTSPQINVSYCDLSATALNQLFTDLTTIVSKTINITGCTGAATCTRSIATAKGWTVTG